MLCWTTQPWGRGNGSENKQPRGGGGSMAEWSACQTCNSVVPDLRPALAPAGFVLRDQKFVFSGESPWKQEFPLRFSDCQFYCSVHKCQQDKDWLQQQMLGGRGIRRKYEYPWVKTSKHVNSCVEEEAISLSAFYYRICSYVCLCRIFNPSMYDISLLHLCYVAVSKLCHLLEFFPIAPLGGGWFKIVFYNKHWR